MKKWQGFMDEFCGSQQKSRPLFGSSSALASSRLPQCSQQDLIDWSSSDEEASRAKSSVPGNNSSSVVVRLDFNTVDPWAPGLSKPSVSRDVTILSGQEEAKKYEEAHSPVLVRNARKFQSFVDDDDLFKSQEELPVSPILEAKRRKSPVLRRKRRNILENLNAVTPQKVQKIEEPSSPVISVTHRRLERPNRRETTICDVNTQPRSELACVDSPVKSPDIRNRSSASISPVESPKRAQNFASQLAHIEETSQGDVECSAEQLIECPSSQDTKTSSGLQIQSASSVSDTVTVSQNLHSDSSAKEFPLSIPPLDSSKKTKKPRRNGLMEQLHRVKNRQRSLHRMWLHEKQSGGTIIKGVTLGISSISTFGSKMIVYGKFAHNFKRVLIICDQEQISKVKAKPLDFITIYPPWQTFDAAWSGATIIVSLSIFEKTQAPADFDLNEPADAQEEPMLKEVKCQCSKDTSISPSKCTSSLKESRELLDLLLKSNAWTEGCKLRAVEVLDNSNQEIESQLLDFTISDAIEVHAKSSTAPLRLKVTCQKIFVSRRSTDKEKLLMSQGSQTRKDVWIMLGNDSTGAFCLIELKGGLRSAFKEGDSYWLQGLSLFKRLEFSRRPDIVSLISALAPEWKKAPYVYKFVAGRGCTLDRCSQVHPWLPTKITDLQPATNESNNWCRKTVMAKFLAFEASYLYATDITMSSEAIPYTAIHASERTVIPNFSHGTIIVIRDLLIVRGDVTADEFTSIFEAENIPRYNAPLDFSKAHLDQLKEVDAKILNLSPQVNNHQLVQVKGTICGVDEDNSYSWPVCSNCGGEFLQDLPNNVICCSTCHSDGPFTNKVALSVYISPSRDYNYCGDDSNKILIKVGSANFTLNLYIHKNALKLHQSTVSSILPGWDENEMFGVESVLGQEIGPLVCSVAFSDESNCLSLCQVPF